MTNPRTLRLSGASPSHNEIAPSPCSKAPWLRALGWRERTQALAAGYRLANRLPREDRRCTVVVVRVVTSQRRFIRDDANLRGGCKPIIDGLVRGGLLADDSDRWMRATYEQRVGPVEETRITITPDAEGARMVRRVGRAANGRKPKARAA